MARYRSWLFSVLHWRVCYHCNGTAGIINRYTNGSIAPSRLNRDSDYYYNHGQNSWDICAIASKTDVFSIPPPPWCNVDIRVLKSFSSKSTLLGGGGGSTEIACYSNISELSDRSKLGLYLANRFCTQLQQVS